MTITSTNYCSSPCTGKLVVFVKRFAGVFRLHSTTHAHRCVLGWWIALDDTDADNGCMHFWPGSQHKGIVEHALPVPSGPTAHIYYGVATPPPPHETACVPLRAGDAIIFDVSCVHGTPANRTDQRRWALQMQYAPYRSPYVVVLNLVYV